MQKFFKYFFQFNKYRQKIFRTSGIQDHTLIILTSNSIQTMLNLLEQLTVTLTTNLFKRNYYYNLK